MKIKATEIAVKDLVSGYVDDDEQGVSGYGGALDIRPAYQREFVYNEYQQKAVIDTLLKGLPLNTMYWVKTIDPATDEEHFEVLDGQQRTISIARFVTGGFSVTDPHSNSVQFFSGLAPNVKQAVLDYKLQVYVCEGSDSDRLSWFRTINVAGAVLTEQELRNANYAGPWLSHAKVFFSKPGGAAATLADGLIKAKVNRQELLEKALDWISQRDKLPCIEAYMAKHHNDPNAVELRNYFKAIIAWVEEYFGPKRKVMEGVDWGRLYNEHGARTDLDPTTIQDEVSRLMRDEEVQTKKGIFEYVLLGSGVDPKSLRLLNLRTFGDNDKALLYERQGGKCADPHWTGHDPEQIFAESEMAADHKIPWSQGGRTELSNGQLLCAACNAEKSDK